MERVFEGRMERVGGWREWEESYRRGASIPTDLRLFLFSIPLPLHSVEIMPGQQNLLH